MMEKGDQDPGYWDPDRPLKFEIGTSRPPPSKFTSGTTEPPSKFQNGSPGTS